MGMLQPSIAKIVTTPFIAVILLFVFIILTQGSTIEETYVALLTLIIALIIAYLLSCFIWFYGKKRNRTIIVVFTLFFSSAAYFVFSTAFSFFSLCLTDLGLPCLAGESCPAPRPCPFNIIEATLSYLSVIMPVFILIIGTLFFIRAGKKKK